MPVEAGLLLADAAVDTGLKGQVGKRREGEGGGGLRGGEGGGGVDCCSPTPPSTPASGGERVMGPGG